MHEVNRNTLSLFENNLLSAEWGGEVYKAVYVKRIILGGGGANGVGGGVCSLFAASSLHYPWLVSSAVTMPTPSLASGFLRPAVGQGLQSMLTHASKASTHLLLRAPHLVQAPSSLRLQPLQPQPPAPSASSP